MSYDISEVRKFNWNVEFGDHDCGGVDDVDPSGIEVARDPITIGSAGPMKLDDWIDGLSPESAVKVTARNITRARAEQLCPWFVGASGEQIPIIPLPGTRMTSYAKELVLHPTDQTDTSEDLVFYQAVPKRPLLLRKANGKDFDKVEMEFLLYPDPSLIGTGTNPYGYVRAGVAGGAPAAQGTVAAASASATSVTVTWDCTTSGAATRVQKSLNGVDWTNVATTSADAETYTVTGLTTGVLCYFRVRAEKTNQVSVWSSRVSATPTAA